MMQSMGFGTMSQGFYKLSPTRQPTLQVPNLAPGFSTGPLTTIQQGMPQFGYYAPMNIPICPPHFSRFPPLMPQMDFGTESSPWRQARPLLYPPQIQFPSQTFQSVYSISPSSDTITPTIYSQPEITVPVQPSYHMPETSQVGYPN